MANLPITAPSVKTIKDKLGRYLSDPDKQAKEIRGIIRGDISPENYESVKNWLSKSYNRPSLPELKMEALNEILEGHGIEAEFSSGTRPWIEWVNMGDMYTPTVYRLKGKWRIGAVGDVFERRQNPAKRKAPMAKAPKKNPAKKSYTFGIHLNAGNTTSGNPRRLFVLYSSTGNVVDIIDEGYRGIGAVSDAGYSTAPPIVGQFRITPGEYAALLKRKK